MDATHNDPAPDEKMVLRPLIGLMHGRALPDIERYTLLELEKYRRLRDEAVSLEASLETLAGDGEEFHDINRCYVTAMIAVHAQQTVVSTLLDILGYVPQMSKQQPH